MRVLFVCTHNRCRSILGEAIGRHVAGDVLNVSSAGSQPAGEVHPLTLKYLAEKSISTEALRSKSWDEFDDSAPDLVITVCDSAANEACPLWPQKTQKLHWGLPDPSKIDNDDQAQRKAFFEVIATLENRITRLAALVKDDECSVAAMQNIAKEIPHGFV